MDRTTSTSFSVSSIVRGYHIYKDSWDASIGEELSCQREAENYTDPFAVAVMKDDNIVGHVPRKISTVCSLFLRRGGLIVCRVTGRRRHSQDLPQGDVEILCMLVFQGDFKYVDKAKKLLLPTEGSTNDQTSDASKSTLAVEPTSTVVAKTVEVRPDKIELDAGSQVTAEVRTVWVKKGSIILYDEHKQMILNDDSKLNDLVINAA